MGKYLDYLLAVEHFLDEAVNLAEVALLCKEIAAGEACKFLCHDCCYNYHHDS